MNANGSYWYVLFRKLGLDTDISTFKKRKRIQKLVYLLKLNPNLSQYLPFKFDMYLAGPYSKELADVYYNQREIHMEGGPIKIRKSDLEYARFLNQLSNSELELLSTIVELIRYHKTRDASKLTWLVKGIKPRYTRRDVEKALDILRIIEEKYGVVINEE